MKSLLLEILLVAQAILFWTLTLPAAAVFALVVFLWNKLSTQFPGESLPPAGARLSRASA